MTNDTVALQQGVYGRPLPFISLRGGEPKKGDYTGLQGGGLHAVPDVADRVFADTPPIETQGGASVSPDSFARQYPFLLGVAHVQQLDYAAAALRRETAKIRREREYGFGGC